LIGGKILKNYVLHLTPNTPEMKLLVQAENEEALANNLALTEVEGWITLPLGYFTLNEISELTDESEEYDGYSTTSQSTQE
jgi:hypothetical protein